MIYLRTTDRGVDICEANTWVSVPQGDIPTLIRALRAEMIQRYPSEAT